jgi:hypothetical protein
MKIRIHIINDMDCGSRPAMTNKSGQILHGLYTFWIFCFRTSQNISRKFYGPPAGGGSLPAPHPLKRGRGTDAVKIEIKSAGSSDELSVIGALLRAGRGRYQETTKREILIRRPRYSPVCLPTCSAEFGVFVF